MRKITDNIYYIGVCDKKIDLFEAQYKVPHGISYNSYVIIDEKIAVFDTVDIKFTSKWLNNLEVVLSGRTPDYLVISHMEPDHSASIVDFIQKYPNAKIVGNTKTFAMMSQFFSYNFEGNKQVVAEGESISLGEHNLTFIFAPMIHWPEVMMTYESKEKILFSADAFGKFGCAEDIFDASDWVDEARRYYIGIVGKYGQQVQALIGKISKLDIQKIFSLHGPILTDNICKYVNLYKTWSSYSPETDGIMIAYTSIYGHTKEAALTLASILQSKGCPNVTVYDLSRSDIYEAVGQAFRFSKLVLATTTYNMDIYPAMSHFIHHLIDRNYQNRTVAIVENGSWAPAVEKTIKSMFEKSKNITFALNTVKIKSALNSESSEMLQALADELCKEYLVAKAENEDLRALQSLGYGVYLVTTNDGTKDNGSIVISISQVTQDPLKFVVAINKNNFTHEVIKKTGILNVCGLDIDTNLDTIARYGFVSGRNTDKFAGVDVTRSKNGLVYPNENVNSFISLKVESYIDLGSHGMFVCALTESKLLTNKETMTYSYYQNNIKPNDESGEY